MCMLSCPGIVTGLTTDRASHDSSASELQRDPSHVITTHATLIELAMMECGFSMTFKIVRLQEKMLVEYDNAKVLVTDMKIETIKEIIPILEQVTRINQPLIIIAEDVAGVLPGVS